MPQNVALYIHWPFCLSKCPYCDFNSHVRAQIDEEAWEKGLLTDLKNSFEKTAYTKVTSIFFGGGTPSLMNPKTVESLLKKGGHYWEMDSDCEVTLEANPNAIDREKLKSFRDAGINRLSLGIQALNSKDLSFLGRSHSYDEAIAAIETGRSIFDNFSFDLIYARPNQTVEEWEKELSYALSFKPDHLSLYQLTIEPGTLFSTLYQRGDLLLPKEDDSADLYELTQKMTEENGFYRYEVSNHACLGRESQHNLAYWRYQDYLGIGPGAHGRLTTKDGQKIATKQKRAPEPWLQSILTEGDAYDEWTPLNQGLQKVERFMMGMRLVEGVQIQDISDILNLSNISVLENEGFVKLHDGVLKPTSKGLLCLNKVMDFLLIDSVDR